jgi:hypothetical protein
MYWLEQRATVGSARVDASEPTELTTSSEPNDRVRLHVLAREGGRSYFGWSSVLSAGVSVYDDAEDFEVLGRFPDGKATPVAIAVDEDKCTRC